MTKNQKTRFSNRSRLSPDPPQLQEDIRIRHTFRFSQTAGGALTNITQTDLLGVCGVIGTVVNTDVATLASTVRVRCVRLYGAAPAQGAVSVARISFAGAANSPDSIKNDVSMNPARGPYVMGIPPPRSLASFWQQAGGATVFSVGLSAGGIADVDLDFCLTDQLSNTTIAVATAFLGAVYYLALDGPAANAWKPVGLPTTH